MAFNSPLSNQQHSLYTTQSTAWCSSILFFTTQTLAPQKSFRFFFVPNRLNSPYSIQTPHPTSTNSRKTTATMKCITSILIIAATFTSSVLAVPQPVAKKSPKPGSAVIYVSCLTIQCSSDYECTQYAGQERAGSSFWTDSNCALCLNGYCAYAAHRPAPPAPRASVVAGKPATKPKGKGKM